MALTLLHPTPARRGLLAVEWLTLAYAVLTAVALTALHGLTPKVAHLLLERTALCAGMTLPIAAYRASPSRLTLFLRMLYVMVLLGYWYPDTFQVCSALPYLDSFFARADAWLFGCQPAAEWSKALPQRWVSEAFCLGYLAYFPMIAVVTFYALLQRPRQLEETTFVIMASFLAFYTVFLFVPVAGPQYYYPWLGHTAVEAGAFAPVPPQYFALHPTLPAATDAPDGPFHTLLQLMQAGGERPTAAFPSSHVGVSTVLLLLSRRLNRRLMLALLPVYVLLCGATVYIGAHYAVDALAGLPCGVAAYALTRRAYAALARRGA